jgi:hypothetical protein
MVVLTIKIAESFSSWNVNLLLATSKRLFVGASSKLVWNTGHDTQGEKSMSDSVRGELMRVDQNTGELVPAAVPETTIDDIVRSDTGGVARQIVASFELTSEDGQNRIDRHEAYQGGQNEHAQWYNVPFNLAAFSSKAVLVKKGADGSRLDEPRLAVRTVIEMDDGRMLTSSSSWLFQSMKDIIDRAGGVSPEKPIRVVMRKAGGADKLFRVQPEQAPQLTNTGATAKKTKS